MNATRKTIKEANAITKEYVYCSPEDIRHMYERLEEIGVTVGLITNRKDFPELGSWQGTCEWYINGEEVENSLFVYSVYEGGERNEYTIYFS